MTQQICDVVEIAGEPLGLAEADDGWAGFDPKAHGLPLTFAGTDCWHGFVCVYRVEELLLLDEVSIAWSKAFTRGAGPELFGRRAQRVKDGSLAWAHYESLQQPVAFTAR